MFGLPLAWSWLTGTETGKKVLKGVVLVIIVGVLTAVFFSWKQGVYDSGFKAGGEKARAECEAARKAYFDEAAAAVKRIEEAAKAGADKVVAANASSSTAVDKVVGAAIKKWGDNPVVVVKDGKCAPTPQLSSDWNAVNKEANK